MRIVHVAVVALLVAVPAMAGCLQADDAGGLAGAGTGAGTLVVTSHPEATAAGLAILAAGGNAIDAAAAVQFALNIVEPMMSGIGGGVFILHYDAVTGNMTSLDGREVAPASARPDRFQNVPDDGLPVQERGIAVGVPGTLAAWHEALANLGTMDLATVMAPGIRLADAGFTMDEVTRDYIAGAADKLRRSPDAANTFLTGAMCPPPEASGTMVAGRAVIVPCQGGEPVPVGALVRQPELAATLATIGAAGPDAFYQGPIAAAIVEAVTDRGGDMTPADIAAYQPTWRESVTASWRGHTVASMPLPGSGIVLLEALGVLETLNTAGRDDATVQHRIIEALHLAFADRAAYLGDPDTSLATADDLLAPDFIAQRRALLDPNHTAAPYPPGTIAGPDAPAPATTRQPVVAGAYTTHFTIRDAEGNIVAATSTIESAFGSGIVVPGYGFFLNNELTDFDREPGGPNQVGPGKTPLSSMTPTIVLGPDGEPVLALGSPGGSTIPGTILQVLLDVMHGTELQAAVDAPRWAARLGPELGLEPTFDAGLAAALAARGHEVSEVSRIGGVQAITLGPEGWVGAADWRRAGSYGSV